MKLISSSIYFGIFFLFDIRPVYWEYKFTKNYANLIYFFQMISFSAINNAREQNFSLKNLKDLIILIIFTFSDVR